ncbi:hypothetical protein BT63DRAFT_474850 [Microthyrium microscopicum]|uniref:Uncharacterized protein n=1 Tax=Microthyrium microscopicum TaxID=703497 RepID=A0A6A6UW54_9PEZI|nr:hypothetical protein BT63DRAFT_474850 [Microthyrium microscopicum]
MAPPFQNVQSAYYASPAPESFKPTVGSIVASTARPILAGQISGVHFHSVSFGSGNPELSFLNWTNSSSTSSTASPSLSSRSASLGNPELSFLSWPNSINASSSFNKALGNPELRFLSWPNAM